MEIFKRFIGGKHKKEVNKGKIETVKSGGSLFQESDIYGLVHYLSNIPDIDETLLMAGLTRRDLRKLETDDEISAALETRQLGVLATPYRFEGKNSADVVFIKDQLDVVIDQFMRHAWQAMPYGFSVIEAIYTRLPDQRIGIDRMLYKPFWWFQPRPDGSLTPYMQQETVLDSTFKFFLTRRNPSYIQPYGEAILSRLYWPWYFRQAGWDHWMRWLARYGTPPLIGTGQNLELLNEALMQAINAPAIAVPEGTTVTVANPVTGAGHFPEFENAVTKRIQKMILGQTLTTDVGSSGSFAAAKVHNNVRDDKRLADCKVVGKTVQQLVDALVLLNGLQPVQFVMEDKRKLNAERAGRDATLVNAGIVALSRDYLLRAYDFDDDDLDDVQINQSTSNSNMAFQFAEARKKPFTAAQQSIEKLVDDAINQAGTLIDGATIMDAIKQSKSANDMVERLSVLAEGYSAPAFAELVERSLFAADVFGYIKSEQNQY